MNITPNNGMPPAGYPPANGTDVAQKQPGATGLASGPGRLDPTAGLDPARQAAMNAKLQSLQNTGSRVADLLPPPQSPAPAAHLAAALDKLDRRTVSGDIEDVMELFQQVAREQRDAARADRVQAIEAQIQAMSNAVDAMREAATQRFVEAVIGGIMQLASAQMSLGTSGMGSAIMGGARGDKGVGLPADRVAFEAQSKTLADGTQQANELVQQMMDVIQDVRDKLGAIQQSQLETHRGIVRNV